MFTKLAVFLIIIFLRFCVINAFSNVIRIIVKLNLAYYEEVYVRLVFKYKHK